MLSVRFDHFGEPREVLQIIDAPTPEPGPGEVLVRLRARPINPSDLLTVRGLYGIRPPLPATPGYEGAGEVERLGPGAGGFEVGQRVIPVGIAGTWQEFLIARPSQLIPCPDAISDATAAQFSVNPFTAWVLTVDELAVKPGEWLLQTAAGSTLGQMVLQLARRRGFKTINVVRRREQVAELKQLGADEVVCTADEDLVGRVLEITGGQGVRAAIDAVGGEVGAAAAKALSPGGTMIVYGLLSLQPIPLDVGQMIFRTSTVRGFWLAEWARRVPEEKRRATIGELLTLMAQGALAPPVDAEYELKDAREAVQHAESGGLHGKVLLVSRRAQ